MRKRHRSKSLNWFFVLFEWNKVLCLQENDRTILIEQFRETSNELNRAKLTVTQMESEVNSLRGEIQSRDSEMKRLLDRAQFLEKELEKVGENAAEFVCWTFVFVSANFSQSRIRNSTFESESFGATKRRFDKKTSGRQNEFWKRDRKSSRFEFDDRSEKRTTRSSIVESRNRKRTNPIGQRRSEDPDRCSQESAEQRTIDEPKSQRNHQFAARERVSARHSLPRTRFRPSVSERSRQLVRFENVSLSNKIRKTFLDKSLFSFSQNQNKEIAALRTSVVNLESENKRLKSLLTSERYER